MSAGDGLERPPTLDEEKAALRRAMLRMDPESPPYQAAQEALAALEALERRVHADQN
jgi:hypothetical protein